MFLAIVIGGFLLVVAASVILTYAPVWSTWPDYVGIALIVLGVLGMFVGLIGGIVQSDREQDARYEQACHELGGVVTFNDDGDGQCMSPDGLLIEIEKVK